MNPFQRHWMYPLRSRLPGVFSEKGLRVLTWEVSRRSQRSRRLGARLRRQLWISRVGGAESVALVLSWAERDSSRRSALAAPASGCTWQGVRAAVLTSGSRTCAPRRETGPRSRDRQHQAHLRVISPPEFGPR